METEYFKRLKAICEKEGFDIASDSFYGKTYYHIEPRDIWDGVEFAESTGYRPIGNIFKIESSNDHDLQYRLRKNGREGKLYSYKKKAFKPSTESEYVEQLKKEAFERFGEIEIGDKFNRDWDIKNEPKYGIGIVGDNKDTGFEYRKSNDSFMVKGTTIYREGKWATRVKERVEVEMSECVANFGTYQPYTIEAKFTIKNVNDYDHSNLPSFLRSQLEKYLNREVE